MLEAIVLARHGDTANILLWDTEKDRRKIVTVDVGNLSPEDYEDWRLTIEGRKR